MESLPVTIEANANLFTASRSKAPPVPTADAGPKSNATFDLGLPNAIKGHVVTRFPPEPSGYLHIGHAKVSHFFISFVQRRLMTGIGGDLESILCEIIRGKILDSIRRY